MEEKEVKPKKKKTEYEDYDKIMAFAKEMNMTGVIDKQDMEFED